MVVAHDLPTLMLSVVVVVVIFVVVVVDKVGAVVVSEV